jgi:hypothetical protein
MLGGCRVHILRRDFQFFQQPKFKNLQLFVPNSKRLGAILSECTFSLKNHTSLGRLLQGRTTSMLHVERTRNEGSLQVQPWNAWGLVDAGSTGFPNNVTTSRGPWPSPRTRARRGVASATPDPSRIGQTSRIPMESNYCILFRTPSLDPTRIVTAPQPSLPNIKRGYGHLCNKR